MLKVSIVNYTNTLPFRYGLKYFASELQIDLQEDIPSICAQKLQFNQVDLALVPVAILPTLKNYFIETDFCIGADGAVDSVKLYSQVPLNEIRTITLDYQSKSSITLTKILAKNFWKINPVYIQAQPDFEKNISATNAAVVIGDRTFNLNNTIAYEYDLALEWKKFTSLPFVFAAWVSLKKLDEQFISTFNKALSFGLQNTTNAIEASLSLLPTSKEITEDYLTNKISYNLNQNKLAGLNLFLDYIKKEAI